MRQLPEELAVAFEILGDGEYIGTTPSRTGRGVAGRVSAPGLGRALIFVGLFGGAVPQGFPKAGVVLTSPEEFRIADVPDGIYHLMAAAAPISGGPESLLLPGSSLCVGRAERLITVRNGDAEGYTDIILRPLLNTDPPVLISLPMLLIKLVNSEMSPVG